MLGFGLMLLFAKHFVKITSRMLLSVGQLEGSKIVIAVSLETEVSTQDQRSNLPLERTKKDQRSAHLVIHQVAKKTWRTIDPDDMKFTRFKDNNRTASNNEV